MPTLQQVNVYSNYTKAKKKIKEKGLDPKRLFVSDKPMKKYYYQWADGKRTYFGLMGYQDYLKHNDEQRRQRFLKRNAKWASFPQNSPAWFSYYITW